MLDAFLITFKNMYGSFIPAFEIIILSVIFYYILNYLRGTRASSILAGIIFVTMVLTISADLLNFEVISWLLNGLWTFIAIALIIIFQPEIRRAFAQIGTNPFRLKQKREETINEIITATINLAGRRHGALIVIEQQLGLRTFAENAIKLDARLSHYLLETIFFPNTPLHDGGVIIKHGKIRAANCILPLSTNHELTRGMGTRHRAALGVTEESDALVLVISEETGSISIAYKGNFKKNIKPDKLRRFLDILLTEEKGRSFKEIVDDVADEEEIANT